MPRGVYIRSEEAKQKMSEAQKIREFTEDRRKQLEAARYAKSQKVITEESRRKMGVAQKNRMIKEIQEGKINPFFIKGRKGRKPSEETRRKLSEANKGKKHTKEHCKKISEANKKRFQSIYERVKLSEALKGDKNRFWKGGQEGMWKRRHVSTIRFRPISTEELNAILQEND